MNFTTEVQYYIKLITEKSQILKYSIKRPAVFDHNLILDDSFFEVLFNEEYSDTSYKYLFVYDPNALFLPSNIRTRIMVNSNVAYYVPTHLTSGKNIFELSQEDLKWLDILLKYRHNFPMALQYNSDSTSTVIITNSDNSIDITSNYDVIQSELSKLIFAYLLFKIKSSINEYVFQISNVGTFSNQNIAAIIFELFLIDQIFTFVTNK